MLNIRKTPAPLTVLVTKERWDAFGPPTRSNRRQLAVLQAMGGINHSVTPGTYHFTARRRGLKMICSLHPAE